MKGSIRFLLRTGWFVKKCAAPFSQMLRIFALVLMLNLAGCPLFASNPPAREIDLWPGNPPEMVEGATRGADDGTGRVRDVGIPGALVYLPEVPAPAGGRIAIIVCPGGGYSHLTRLVGADGAVKSFVPRNVAIISLRYRTRPPSPSVDDHALADGKRAVRLVRHHAEEWGIDPRKIGMLGWSAGANLALNVASHFDDPGTGSGDFSRQHSGTPEAEDSVESESSRPDFVVLLSPWPSRPPRPIADFPISKNAPPAFIASARDDKTAPVTFAKAIADAYQKAGVAHELWVVETGGHGAFTIDAPGEGGRWIERFWPWLEKIGISGKKSAVLRIRR